MRIPDEIWDEMLRVTAFRGETVTGVTIELMKGYLRAHAGELEEDEQP